MIRVEEVEVEYGGLVVKVGCRGKLGDEIRLRVREREVRDNKARAANPACGPTSLAPTRAEPLHVLRGITCVDMDTFNDHFTNADLHQSTLVMRYCHASRWLVRYLLEFRADRRASEPHSSLHAGLRTPLARWSLHIVCCPDQYLFNQDFVVGWSSRSL